MTELYPTRFPKNAWYVCAWAGEVGRDLLARTICNEPVVMFRTEDGAPAAIEDRCCHRHLPLSEGELIGDIVQCGYHGLQFDRSGTCVSVPGQTRVPPGAAIKSYPTVERHRAIWIWPGDPAAADEALIPDFSWAEKDGWDTVCDALRIECNAMLLVDNLLDLTHETYLHDDSLGNEAVVEWPIETDRTDDRVSVTRWMMNHEPAPFLKAAIGKDVLCDRWQMIYYTPPFNVTLDVGVAEADTGAPEGDRSKGVWGWVLNGITPETETSCWHFWGYARNYLRDDAAVDQRLHDQVVTIFNQDKVVLEAQQGALEAAPDGFDFVDINADSGNLQARRMYEAFLAQEEASKPAAE